LSRNLKSKGLVQDSDNDGVPKGWKSRHGGMPATHFHRVPRQAFPDPDAAVMRGQSALSKAPESRNGLRQEVARIGGPKGTAVLQTTNSYFSLTDVGSKGDDMWGDFKKFALRGNVVDLAIGVIIGAAFGAIVSSMVGDIIMPVVGAVAGGLDFSNYYLPLSSAVKTGLPLSDAKKAGAVLAYGNFITVTINFIIIAFVLFLIIRLFSRMEKKENAGPSEPPATEKLLAEIRDLLARRI
jgi:large conductance mechanosensitive channel